MAEEAQRIFVVCSDLMFSASIRGAGQSPDAVLEFIGSAESFDEALIHFQAVLFLLDLHHPTLGGEASSDLIKKLKASPRNKSAYAIAWGKHTEPKMLKDAERAGFDKVMARSSFVKDMPEIVERAVRRIRNSA